MLNLSGRGYRRQLFDDQAVVLLRDRMLGPPTQGIGIRAIVRCANPVTNV